MTGFTRCSTNPASALRCRSEGWPKPLIAMPRTAAPFFRSLGNELSNEVVARAVRQTDVADDQIEGLRSSQTNALGDSGGGLHLIAALMQQSRGRPGGVGVIFDQQNLLLPISVFSRCIQKLFRPTARWDRPMTATVSASV